MSDIVEVKASEVQPDLVEMLQISIEDYQEYCRKNPDAVPELVEKVESKLAYMVGYWWLALTDGQKRTMKEKHPLFAEKYTDQICTDYATVCKRISLVRTCTYQIIQTVPIRTAMQISKAFGIEADKGDVEALASLEQWFTVVLTVPKLSSTYLKTAIEASKQFPKEETNIINMLPTVIKGKRDDKGRLEKMLFALEAKRFEDPKTQSEFEQRIFALEGNISGLQAHIEGQKEELE